MIKKNECHYHNFRDPDLRVLPPACVELIESAAASICKRLDKYTLPEAWPYPKFSSLDAEGRRELIEETKAELLLYLVDKARKRTDEVELNRIILSFVHHVLDKASKDSEPRFYVRKRLVNAISNCEEIYKDKETSWRLFSYRELEGSPVMDRGFISQGVNLFSWPPPKVEEHILLKKVQDKHLLRLSRQLWDLAFERLGEVHALTVNAVMEYLGAHFAGLGPEAGAKEELCDSLEADDENVVFSDDLLKEMELFAEECIEGWTHARKMAFWLHFLEERSMKEISAAIGLANASGAAYHVDAAYAQIANYCRSWRGPKYPVIPEKMYLLLGEWTAILCKRQALDDTQDKALRDAGSRS